MRKREGGLATLTSVRNVRIDYPFVTGTPQIAELMGPSYFPENQIGERYFQRIRFVVGCDFRLFPSNETYYVQLIAPPTQNGIAVLPHPDRLSFPANASTPAPVTQVHLDEYCQDALPEGFTGIWRTGLELDCGKDLPRLEMGQSLPYRPFVADPEEALGTCVVEIGYLY